MTLTKADLVEAVYNKVGFSKRKSVDVVEMVFNTMKETLGRGEKIKITGFGNFELRDKRARNGRNPQTGKVIEISARRVLTFKASQALKNAVNGNRKVLTPDGSGPIPAPSTPATSVP